MSAVLRLVVMMMSKLSSPSVTYATWNPSDKAASFTLSGGDLVVAMSSTVGQIRSTIGKSSGKWYWENVVTGSVIGPILGVATSAPSVNNYTGQDSTSWGYYGSNGNKYTSATGSAYGATYATGDVIGTALDMDNGTVTFYKNGVSQGVAFTGLTGTVYAAAGQTGANVVQNTANFGATALTYSPPSGYNAGLYT